MDNSINTARFAAFSPVKASQKTLNPAKIDMASPGFNAEVAKVASDVTVAQPAAARRTEVARAPVAADRPVRQAAPEVSVLYAGRNTVVRAEAPAGRGVEQTSQAGTSVAEKLRSAFQAVDGDGDKKITKDELFSFLTSQYKSISSNQDTAVAQADMAKFMVQQQQVLTAFEAFSVDGVLDASGLAKMAQLAERVDTIA